MKTAVRYLIPMKLHIKQGGYMKDQLTEATFKYKDYYECPTSCGAIYHTYSFTHREFECKDCRSTFLVPENVKLNKPKPFKKRVKREVSNG